MPNRTYERIKINYDTLPLRKVNDCDAVDQKDARFSFMGWKSVSWWKDALAWQTAAAAGNTLGPQRMTFTFSSREKLDVELMSVDFLAFKLASLWPVLHICCIALLQCSRFSVCKGYHTIHPTTYSLWCYIYDLLFDQMWIVSDLHAATKGFHLPTSPPFLDQMWWLQGSPVHR